MAKNGLHLITPTSIAYTGTSASISANGSVTFSAVSNVTLNGVFSADYDNYMIVVIETGDVGTRMRIASSGVNQTANYTSQYIEVNGSSIGSARSAFGSHLLNASASYVPGGSVTNIYGPYLNQPTALRTINMSGYGSTGVRFLDAATTHSLSNSYDGVSILPSSSSSLTGRIAVYGMRK